MDIHYPRPNFVRPAWHSLNGAWSYSFQDSHDPASVSWQGWIEVPFPPESPQSGVNETGYHPVIWYQRRFQVPDEWLDRRIMLHFGAVDYAAQVWLNGRYLTSHEGGHTPFSADITKGLVEGEQILTVRVEDDPLDMEKPRGKQDWEREPHLNWYPRSSGIWQPVWIEPVPRRRIASLRILPDVPQFALGLEVTFEGDIDQAALDVQLRMGDHLIINDRWSVVGDRVNRWITLPDPGVDSARRGFLWRPEHPVLFDLQLTLRCNGQVTDQVETYAALRSVEARDGAIYLNGRPYFLLMVLDQGYWPEGHLAPPSAESFRREVELTKSLGFNGVRKYQKIEDPRYLYWADRLGLLVWSEMPSFYRFSPRAAERMMTEFLAVVKRDFNHPSIVAWVPFNKSWGVSDLQRSPQQRHFVEAMVHLAKALDPTRLVIDNDGWEHIRTDVLTIHDYLNDPEVFSRRYGSHEAVQTTLERRPIGRDLSMDGFVGEDVPVVLSEFGGLRMRGGEGWGYGEIRSPDEFLARFRELVESVSHSALAGFCYNQLADTFQEQTGLLYADRRPKLEPEAVAQILRTCIKNRTSAEV